MRDLSLGVSPRESLHTNTEGAATPSPPLTAPFLPFRQEPGALPPRTRPTLITTGRTLGTNSRPTEARHGPTSTDSAGPASPRWIRTRRPSRQTPTRPHGRMTPPPRRR